MSENINNNNPEMEENGAEQLEQSANGSAEAEEVSSPVADKTSDGKKQKSTQKKPNAFKRFGAWIKNLFRGYKSELGKVVWTPKSELKKSTLLVVLTVAVFGIVIGIVDTTFYYLTDFIAKLI